MVTDWIQAASTIVLIIVTICYTRYTKTLAQIGREPILHISVPTMLNIRCDLEIINDSEFYAKDISLNLKKTDDTIIIFSGAYVISPKSTEKYKAVEQPFFKSFEPGDKMILKSKSILGRQTALVYEFKAKELDVDQEIPAGFNLIDVSHR